MDNKLIARYQKHIKILVNKIEDLKHDLGNAQVIQEYWDKKEPIIKRKAKIQVLETLKRSWDIMSHFSADVIQNQTKFMETINNTINTLKEMDDKNE